MENPRNNFFLVVEGLDGSGKTEVVRRLYRILSEKLKDNLLLTFEPHDPSAAGLFIRQVLGKKLQTSGTTLALAFALNRADHNEREIIPFLDKGKQKMVLCDRYYLSSLVYQGEELDEDEIMLMNQKAKQPDLTIFLDASIQTCYKRMRSRPENKELFERDLAKTKESYSHAIEYLRSKGELIEVIDANGDIPDVMDKVMQAINKHSPGWLQLHPSLLSEELLPPDVFTLNGELHGHEREKLSTIATKFSEVYNRGPLVGPSHLRETLNELNEQIRSEVDSMSVNDLGWLLIGYLNREGYKLGENLKWSELSAYELEYHMPLSIVQKGTLLILNDHQGYDKIRQKVHEIIQSSNFMIVLDSKRYNQEYSYFEQTLLQYSKYANDPFLWVSELREFLEKNNKKVFGQTVPMLRFIENKVYESLSPSIHIVKRTDLAQYVLLDEVKSLRDEHFQTLREFSDLRDVLNEFLQESGLAVS